MIILNENTPYEGCLVFLLVGTFQMGLNLYPYLGYVPRRGGCGDVVTLKSPFLPMPPSRVAPHPAGWV